MRLRQLMVSVCFLRARLGVTLVAYSPLCPLRVVGRTSRRGCDNPGSIAAVDFCIRMAALAVVLMVRDEYVHTRSQAWVVAAKAQRLNH